MNVTESKMKFLAVKLSALKSELKVSREIFNSASREVESMFNKKYFPEIPVKQKPQIEKDVEQYSEKPDEECHDQDHQYDEENLQPHKPEKNPDPEVRKMFKEIAKQCHPDKLHDMKDGFEKKKKKQLFEKARAALEDNDLLILSDVAIELGMDVPELSEARLKQAEKKINSIKVWENH